MITNGNGIEFRHLNYFKILAEDLNFRKASERLFISQPALSKQIKLLESLLNQSLFTRNNKQVNLTDFGKEFYTETLIIIKSKENMLQRLNQFDSGEKGVLKIGLVGSSMLLNLPKKIVNYIKEYPQVEIAFEESSNQEQLALLQEHKLDIGFVRTNQITPNLNIRSIYKESFILILPKNHRINASNFKNIAELKNEPFILSPNPKSSMYYNKIVSLCVDAGFSPRVIHKSINAITVFKLVESGLGISILPASFKNIFNLDVTQIELDSPVHHTELFAVWNKHHNNKALSNFLERL